MPQFCHTATKKNGFTLIEVLIVIALLSVLIVATLSMLDPLEQINKGKDTGIENNAVEIIQAFNRYFVRSEFYPWYTVGAGDLPTNTAAYYNTNPSPASYLSELVTADELRANFLTKAPLSELYMTAGPANAPLFICFQPKSKAFRGNSMALYTASGAIQAGCPDSSSSLCHKCYN